MWEDWLNFIVGLWLIVYGIIPGVHGSTGRTIDFLIAGAVLLVAGALAAKSRWPEWFNLLLGIWLIVASFLSWTGVAVALNSVVVGVLVVLFALPAARMARHVRA